MKLTITLQEEQIIEAITAWLKTQGYDAGNGEITLFHDGKYFAMADVPCHCAQCKRKEQKQKP